METYNRYTQQHNSLRNAFVDCASTGKEAVNLGGVTVHSAFKITQSRRIGTMAREVLQNYKSTFIGVKCIIIDEVSMIGCDVLHKINLHLQEIPVYTTNRLTILTSSSAEIFISYRP
ncbi:ATP-dependent DNA helicase [Trichonephila clavipes]|nr:ATP-dependent DNA helicase [Trichonephila clavipes]